MAAPQMSKYAGSEFWNIFWDKKHHQSPLGRILGSTARRPGKLESAQ